MHSAHLIITDTDICFKCQNQQFKVICAATFLKECKSCTSLLEMLFVPHCMEQNSVLQASWDYAVSNYLNDSVDLKIWAFAACIRPKQGKKWLFICWLVVNKTKPVSSILVHKPYLEIVWGWSYLSEVIFGECWTQFITLIQVKWMAFGYILSTVYVASE